MHIRLTESLSLGFNCVFLSNLLESPKIAHAIEIRIHICNYMNIIILNNFHLYFYLAFLRFFKGRFVVE